MMTRRIALITMVLMLAVSTPGSTQAAAGRDLFAFPRSPFRCNKMPVSARDSSQGVGIAIKLIEGSDILSQRVIDAGYSSVGEPLYMVAMVNVQAPGRPFATDGAVVRFGPNNEAAGLRIRPRATLEILGPARADSIAAFARGLEHLSDSENARARDLAARLWDQRCSARPNTPQP